jgi:hypothetical protein
MDLYMRRGLLDDRNPEVIDLSHLLNRLAQSAPTPTFRNANGVAMKLGNFAGIDPDYHGRGLRGAGRLDRAVWEEFSSDRERLTREATTIRVGILDADEAEPTQNPEVAAAHEMLDELAGRPSHSQGFSVSVESRRALERHAMELAEEYYRERGWQVENVAAHASFDLLCTRADAILHVEVKGTQSDGRQILLTRNEVAHARAAFPSIALFVVARIQLGRDEAGNITARGGTTIVLDPWTLDDAGLSALAYEYRVR